MMYLSDFKFIKFLPDCKISSFRAYLPKYLIFVQDFFKTHIDLKEILDFSIFTDEDTNHERNIFFEEQNLENILQTEKLICEHYATILCNPKQPHSITFRHENYTLEDVQFFWIEITVYLTKIPHIEGRLMAPDVRESDMWEGLNTGLWDIWDIFETIKTEKQFIEHGKTHWLYLKRKIEGTITLLHAMHIKKINQDEPSLIYEFSKQVEDILLKNDLPLVETLKLPENAPFLAENKEFEFLYDKAYKAYRKIEKQFLKECDQILLDAWEQEEFSHKLTLLKISLNQWLKAGYSNKGEYLLDLLILVGKILKKILSKISKLLGRA